MAKKFFTLKEVKLNNNCPECYSNNGLQLTFKQQFVENAFYKAITEFAVDNLKEKGLLFFEINQYLGQETKQLLADYGFKNIQLKKDIFGNDRMLMGTK